MQTTSYYVYDPELGQLEATTNCDGTCGYPCDGHEAPGTGTRCQYCYWKPCNCATMEHTSNRNQELQDRYLEQDLG